MEKEFDFTKIGKRMPYQTPDGFFDEMEANIWNEVKPKHHVSRLRLLIGTLSIAACIALAFILYPTQAPVQQQPADTLAQVDKAFSNLSQEDQAYMLQVYDEDVFLNE